MGNNLALHVLLFAMCLGIVAVAAAGTAAFMHVNATRLRYLMQHGSSRSQAVSEVAHRPDSLTASMAFVYLLAVVGATALVIDYTNDSGLDLAARVGVGLCTVIVLLAAQSLARAFGTERPEVTATTLFGPLRLLAAVTSPVVRPAYALSGSIVRRFLGAASDEHSGTSEEELRVLVDAVEETEALEDSERDMIAGIFAMSDRDVVSIMVPRVDVITLPGGTLVGDAIDIFVSSGHSRLPVFEADLDHLVGIVHLRDAVGALRAGREQEQVVRLVRQMHVVPETKKIDELLEEFQKGNIQLAIVVDEYGGTSGIVTLEDLLEEIVGEIHDEYDVVAAPIQAVSAHEVVVDAGVSIHDLNKALDLKLDDAEYETVGGLLYERLGKVPEPGDAVTVGVAIFNVISTTGRRVRRVRVTLNETSEIDG